MKKIMNVLKNRMLIGCFYLFSMQGEANTVFWKGFASDNFAGMHPLILKAIGDANQGHARAYANDTYTEEAIKIFKKTFWQYY